MRGAGCIPLFYAAFFAQVLTESVRRADYNGDISKGGGTAMREVVYVDVLLFVNLFVNYFLLRAAALLSREHARRWRIVLGAALGSTYSLIIFLPPLHPLFLAALKAVMALTIVFAAFGRRGGRAFIRILLCFLAETFLFAGINYAVYTFLRPGGMIYGNSAVYYDISVPMLIAVTAVCYGISAFVSRLIRRNSPEDLEGWLTVRVGERCVRLRALVDSGNGLSDPFTDEPVSVAAPDCLDALFPPETVRFLTEGEGSPAPQDAARMRVIPYGSVGGGGTMRAFRCSGLELHLPRGGQIKITGGLLAVAGRPFDGGRYQVLLNPRLTDGGGKAFKFRGVKRRDDHGDSVEAAPVFRGAAHQKSTGPVLYQRLPDAAAPTRAGGGGARDRAAGRGRSRGA